MNLLLIVKKLVNKLLFKEIINVNHGVTLAESYTVIDPLFFCPKVLWDCDYCIIFAAMKVLFRFLVASVVVLLTSAMPAAWPDDGDPNAHWAILSIDNPVYEAGLQDSGSVVSHDFTIVNTGTMPLVIARGTTSCGCMTVEWPDSAVAVGDSAVVRATIDAGRKRGDIEHYATLIYNGKHGMARVVMRMTVR